MDKEMIIRYAPFVVVCVSLLLQWNMFVTPDKLEIKHREILERVAEKYVTKEQSSKMEAQLNDMQKKLDKIYDIMMVINNENIEKRHKLN